MEQHAIPQQITSYEFKLVGEMTLKQFGKAAGGIILALIINASPLVFFIKWPLMLLFGGGGLALAFVPFQDRPLETWLMAFLRSIYSPTVYIYKKKIPVNWLDIDLSKKIESKKEEEEVLPLKEEHKVREFIESLPSVGREIKIENEEVKSQKAEKQKVESQKVTNQREEVKPADVEDSGEAMVEDYGKANLNLKREKLGATGEAVFGEIPMPDVPEVPNVLVGMVVDQNKKIVEGAIVEIQDKDGNPSRVLKTNQLGQFKTLTQMSDGKYLVVTEKEGYEFDRVEVNLIGKIMEPIRIVAK